MYHWIRRFISEIYTKSILISSFLIIKKEKKLKLKINLSLSHITDHACPPLTSLIILPIRPAGHQIPIPAIFAGRDIIKGEELSFDYEDGGGIHWAFQTLQSTSIYPSFESTHRIHSSDDDDDDLDQKLTICLCGSKRWLSFMLFITSRVICTDHHTFNLLYLNLFESLLV